MLGVTEMQLTLGLTLASRSCENGHLGNTIAARTATRSVSLTPKHCLFFCPILKRRCGIAKQRIDMKGDGPSVIFQSNQRTVNRDYFVPSFPQAEITRILNRIRRFLTTVSKPANVCS